MRDTMNRWRHNRCTFQRIQSDHGIKSREIVTIVQNYSWFNLFMVYLFIQLDCATIHYIPERISFEHLWNESINLPVCIVVYNYDINGEIKAHSIIV